MYRCGELVVYGIHGVCMIGDIEERIVDGKKISYYVLAPIEQSNSKYYIPQHNAAAVAKLRPLLSKKDLEDLLSSDDVRKDAWISDESRRKQYYKELICSGDRASLISMVHSLHKQKQLQMEAGRKFHLCDENFLRDAEKLLSSEFSLVLGIQSNHVAEYIIQKLEK